MQENNTGPGNLGENEKDWTTTKGEHVTDAMLLAFRVAAKPQPKKSILDEAEEIIYGDREELYGHPSLNLSNIAEQWSLYLQQRYGAQFEMEPDDVCWMMVQLKMVRQMNASKRDNLVDAVGYIALIERVEDYEKDQGHVAADE